MQTPVTGPIAIALLFLGAYLAGCFNTGYYLVRWLRGRDIRMMHSGAAGARNASRILGAWGFVPVFVGDAAKGALVVALGAFAVRHGMAAYLLPWLIPVVVIGHIWPIQLGFRGGKGLSVAAGAFLYVDFRVVAGFLVAYFAVGALFKYLFDEHAGKRAGMTAAFVIVPPVALALLGKDWFAPSLAISLLFTISHRGNFSRIPLRAGNEQASPDPAGRS